MQTKIREIKKRVDEAPSLVGVKFIYKRTSRLGSFLSARQSGLHLISINSLQYPKGRYWRILHRNEAN